jgi:hypothetical protein
LPDDERPSTRGEHLLPEEEAAGSDLPEEQAAAILEDSEARSADRNAAPGSVVEHRTSDEATPPAD